MTSIGAFTPEASFWLRLRPRTRQIASAAKLVHDIYGELLDDADAASRIALTVHELMENTSKYSTDDSPSIAVKLVDIGGFSQVRIETRNRSTPSSIAHLVALLDPLLAAASPRTLYAELIVCASRRIEGSGLGLARIRAEAEMDLDYAVEGEIIVITARTMVNLRKSHAQG